ncbi:MlaD family protein [Patulibacter brassicae]|uniref:MlaD family protein n=1 Tax=Patulibacter brassicae TaxID=1705717 RepID=A0ABU4VM03_9ACTN|nr:MlaD family protein [Patulibacter brassicae]MDX8151820.1 MlaD family protein [Patulibacter brassicae]
MSAPSPARRAAAARRRRLVAALLALGAVALVALVAFGRTGPLSRDYEVDAIVTTANQLRPGAAVRIAGLDVGRLDAIEAGPGDTARLRLAIRPGTRIGADARIHVAPRLFFEGNAAIRIDPGSPGAPQIRAGATIPRSRTSVAVQLDQVLDVLTTSVRGGLRRTTGELARALGGRGRTGAAALRAASRELDGALREATVAQRAVRGRRPGDLSGAIGGSAEVATQLAADPAALRSLVASTGRVMGTLGERDRRLSASLVRLLGVVRAAPATLAQLDRTLPAVDRFAVALRPALRAAPEPLRRTTAALEQVRAATGRGELPATLAALRPVTTDLPPLAAALTRSLPLLSSAMRCVDRNVLGTLEREVPDGKLSTGRPVWQDAMHMGAALAGASPNFDGNGTTIRLGVTEGEQALEGVLPGIGTVSTLTRDDVGSLAPAWLGYGVSPPFRPDVACTTQDLPDLDARSSARLQGLRRTSAPTPSAAGRRATRAAARALLDRSPFERRRGR